jgi:hypothetical protein
MQIKWLVYFVLAEPLLILSVIVLTTSARAQDGKPVETIRIEFPADEILVCYGAPLLIKKRTQNALQVITIIADPVLSKSRSIAIVWSFDDIQQLRDYIMENQADLPIIPRAIDTRRCSLFALTLERPPVMQFEAFEWRYSWSPGNRNAGWLTIDDFSDYELCEFDLSLDSDAALSRGHLTSWADYASGNRDRYVSAMEPSK